MIRVDLSEHLIHLTHGVGENPNAVLQDALGRFVGILDERRIRGGSGFIRGGYHCVCFTEAPIAALSHILATQSAAGYKYAPFGVIVTKRWLYQRGGRPAIYGPSSEFEELPEHLKYRHVRFFLGERQGGGDVDFSWEREWRLRADELPLDPGAVTLVVPSRSFKEEIERDRPGWHFLALSDLGVSIEAAAG